MPTIVLKSVPARLHAKLKRSAAAHRRSLNQHTLHLLEGALAIEETGSAHDLGRSYWGRRPLLPAYEAALKAGVYDSGKDGTALVSAARDER